MSGSREQQPSAVHWQAALQAAPDPYLLLSPELVILDATVFRGI
jgi:hypothetical protein